MYEDTRFDCCTYDAPHRSAGIWKFDPLNHGIERRLHQVENSVSNVRDDLVETIVGNSANLPIIVDTEDENATVAVGESGKAVGQIVAFRSPDLLSGEDHFLEF